MNLGVSLDEPEFLFVAVRRVADAVRSPRGALLFLPRRALFELSSSGATAAARFFSDACAALAALDDFIQA